MDPLTDIVTLLRPHGAFSKPITGRGRWGVRYDAQASPSFCIVLEGKSWFVTEGDAPRLLERGDFLLLPFTPAFSLVSELGAECIPGRPSRKGVRHGDPKGAPDFRMIGGTFQIESVNAALLELMSQKIHIRAAEFDTSRLTRIIDLIMDEYAADRPGRDAILHVSWKRCSSKRCAGPVLAANPASGPDRRIARCAHLRRASGHAFRCAARMDRGRIGEARRYVTVGVCGPFCYDHRMCADGIPFAVANESGPGCVKPGRKVARSTGRRNRL